MSGWNLPDDVSERDFDPGGRACPGGEHDPQCRAHEDNLPYYSECGGWGSCVCYAHKPAWTRWFWRALDVWRLGEEVCVADDDPDCECWEIADDDEASRADAAEDARSDI